MSAGEIVSVTNTPAEPVESRHGPYIVVAPYQVHDDGVTFGPGEQLDLVDAKKADFWIRTGWIRPADAGGIKPKKSPALRRSKSPVAE